MSIDSANTSAPDPYDPASFRLSQDFAAGTPTKKIITTIPLRKPHKQEFVRVRSDEEYRFSPAAILQVKEDGELYVVRPHLMETLAGEFYGAAVYCAMTRLGTLFLWPVRLPGDDGRTNNWYTSAQRCAETAMTQWTRVVANMELGAYEATVAQVAIPDPVWPDLTFKEILRIAFRDRVIDDEGHIVVRRLRGLC